MKEINIITKRMKRVLFDKVPAHIILLIAAIIAIFPLYYLVVNVFKTNMEFALSQFAFPKTFYYQNLVEVWERGGLLRAFINTTILAVSGAFGRLFLGSLAAYAFATMEFKGKKFLYYVILATMFLPAVVVMIPLLRLMLSLNLVNTYFAPIIIYIGYLPFTTFVLIAFFKNIPKSIIDAARIDGCSAFRLYLSIVLPLSKPALATLALLSIRDIWNDFLIPLVFLSDENKFTLMLRVLSFRGRYVSELGLMLAGLFISILPMLILLIIFQRYFVKGVMLGSFR